MSPSLAIDDVTACRAHLWQAGFRPVPVFNADADVVSPGKQPLGDKWQLAAQKSPPFCATSPAVAWALNTGIWCQGLRAIDIDIDDPVIASQCRELLMAALGEAPIRFRRGSPRCLLLYRAAVGEPGKITLAGKLGKIEVLGTGQQFVAFGLHPSGAELQWAPTAPGEGTLAELPAITEEQVLAVLTACAAVIEAEPPKKANGHDHATGEAQADELRVLAALAEIPNAGPPDWEWWNRVGMAVWRATGGSLIGEQTFSKWSARNAAYDPAEVLERWAHYAVSPPSQLGAGTLFHLAREARLRRRDEREPDQEQIGPQPDPAGDPGYWQSIEEQAERAVKGGQKPDAPIIPFIATVITQAELDALKPREWVYGHFLIRRFISVVGAPGGAGKTAYVFVVAVSVATGVQCLNEIVHEPGNVWIYNLEDGRDELLKRLKATLLGHGIEFSEIADRIFLDSGRDRPLVIAHADKDGQLVAWPQVPALVTELKRRNIKLFIVDPFVRSHRIMENDNDQMDFVAALWATVAQEADCSILLVHHFRKGGLPGDAASFRGASALIDASRAAVTLGAMTTEEAKGFNIPGRDRWQYVRLDNAKLNLARPPENAVWLKLIGVDIENGTPARQADQVQTVTRWSPPSPWLDLPMDAVVRMLEAITAGPEPGEQFTLTRGGKSTRWVGDMMIAQTGKSEKQVKEILQSWVASKLLLSGRYMSHKQRKERDGLIVDPQRLAEMRNHVSAPWEGEHGAA